MTTAYRDPYTLAFEMLRTEIIEASKVHADIVRFYLIGLAALLSFLATQKPDGPSGVVYLLPLLFSLTLGFYAALRGHEINEKGRYLAEKIEPKLFPAGDGYEHHLWHELRGSTGIPVIGYAHGAIFLLGAILSTVFAAYRV